MLLENNLCIFVTFVALHPEQWTQAFRNLRTNRRFWLRWNSQAVPDRPFRNLPCLEGKSYIYIYILTHTHTHILLAISFSGVEPSDYFYLFLFWGKNRQMQLAVVQKRWGNSWRRTTQMKPLLVTTRRSSWLSKPCLRYGCITFVFVAVQPFLHKIVPCHIPNPTTFKNRSQWNLTLFMTGKAEHTVTWCVIPCIIYLKNVKCRCVTNFPCNSVASV